MNSSTKFDVHENNAQRPDQELLAQGALPGAKSQHLLPTPASMPRKKQIHKNELDAAARVLFPSRPENVDDLMPTPRKNRKNRRLGGFSLYDSMEVEGSNADDKIPIYTDSRDKVPELDHSVDNPFVDKAPAETSSQAPPIDGHTRKRRRRQKVQTNPQIQKAFDRDEGLVYVFRGKKIYKPFPHDSESDREGSPPFLDNDDNIMGSADLPNLRPMTRSSIKPRLLFPAKPTHNEPSAPKPEEEEAPTEIDESQAKAPITPVKQSFEPRTPPTTGHATRSSARLRESPPDQNLPQPSTGSSNERKKISPFDGWARKKAGVAAPKGKKRQADAMDLDGTEEVKRAR